MAESTLDAVTVGNWKLSRGFVNDDGVYVVNRGGSVDARSVVFTTLDDGDLVTLGATQIAFIPTGGGAATAPGGPYPTTEDIAYNVSWTPSSNGTYTAYVYIVTGGGQGPLDGTPINVKVRGWTEASIDTDTSTELDKSADTSTEAEKAADTSTELSKTADVSTEGNKAADASTERTGG